MAAENCRAFSTAVQGSRPTVTYRIGHCKCSLYTVMKAHLFVRLIHILPGYKRIAGRRRKPFVARRTISEKRIALLGLMWMDAQITPRDSRTFGLVSRRKHALTDHSSWRLTSLVTCRQWLYGIRGMVPLRLLNLGASRS
jgi:hypothetical protein